MNYSFVRKFKFISAIIFVVIFVFNFNIFADGNWVKINSRNFQLIGNADEKDIRKVALKLEEFRLISTRIYNKMRVDSSIPTTVIVFKDAESFKEFKPLGNGVRRDWVAGYFLSGTDGNYIALSAEDANKDSFRIIFHEYVHFLINNTLGNVKIPAWLSEGLAGYYEKIEFGKNQKVTLGSASPSQINLLQTKQLITFEDFFKADYSLLDEQNQQEIELFYAQSWILTHYFIHGNSGEKKSQLTNFIDLLKKGKKSDEAFAEAFQLNYRQIENNLRNYISQKSFLTEEFKLESKLNSETDLTFSAISESEAKTFLGDLLFRLNRFDEAETLLKQLVAVNSKNNSANIKLGLLMQRKRDFVSGRKYFEKAIADNPEDFAAHFYYAHSLSREEMSENGVISTYETEKAEKIINSLRKAIAIKPEFIESYELFALVSVVQNENVDEALMLIEKSFSYSPGDQMLLLRKSELLMLKEKFVESKSIASDVLKNAIDEKVRNFAEKTLEKINAYEERIERERKYDEMNPYLIKSEKLLTEENLQEVQKRIEIDSINKNVRKLNAGEKRITGRITKIECAGKGIIYNVESEQKNLKFINQSFNGIIFLTYKIELKGGSIGCDSELKNFYSIITYKSEARENSDSLGEIISVEFVPDYFVFVDQKEDQEF